MEKQYVNIGRKQYLVVRHVDGTISISTTWNTIVPSTASSAHPKYTHRYFSINPCGRIGKKVLALLNYTHN